MWEFRGRREVSKDGVGVSRKERGLKGRMWEFRGRREVSKDGCGSFEEVERFQRADVGVSRKDRGLKGRMWEFGEGDGAERTDVRVWGRRYV